MAETKLTACDIVKIAREIEETGKRSYEEMKAGVTDDHVKRLLEYLADEEAEHSKVFSRLGDALACQPDLLPAPGPEDQAYLLTVMKSGVFSDPKAGMVRARSATTPVAILEFALQFERDSMLFWTKLYRLARAEARVTIQRLIEEEEKHIRDIDQLLTRHKQWNKETIVLEK